MYLKAIELHGFKSFPEKTKITFEKGMSVVVGPNGSGKSNISDAIRWVLGETRSSQLRGSGKMEDIIFGGTQKRSPMGFASVSLILDNSDRDFDVDSDEVSVMRKYYRGGDSEYYINGARVRLRDIQELFFDTGLGKNGYSIVGQGKISEIVTSKPEGRREIFEEASGIAKFRFKKNEAEKKLADAQDNITRLSDILMGLEERVGPLEKESAKAKEFIALSQQKKEMEISLWMLSIDRSKELIRQQQRRLEVFTDDYNNIDEKLRKSENYLEERFLQTSAILAKNDENMAAIRKTEQEISDIAAQKAVMESEKSYCRQQINSLKAELETFEADSRQAGDEKGKIEEKIARLREKIEDRNKYQLQLETSIRLLSEKAKSADDKKGIITANLNESKQALQDKKIQLHGLQTQKNSLQETLGRAKEEYGKAKEYSLQVQKQVDELSDFVSSAKEEITKNQNIKNGLSMKLSSASQKVQGAIGAINANASKQNELSGRIRLLTDLENSMDGFAQSVKTVLNQGKNGALGGILGSVAQLITVEKGYETAIEIALGYALQNVVVENETSAKRAIEYLKNSRAGRATFLPLDTIHPSNFNEKLPAWAKTADSVIVVEGKYKNVISNLLGRTIITDDINSASQLAKNLNYRYRIVTMDGQQINAGGSFTGGSVSKSAGLFTRKTEIEKLKGDLQQLKAQVSAIEKARGEATDAFDLIKSQIAGCEGEIETLTQDKINAELELAKQNQLLSQYSSAYEMQSAIAENASVALSDNEKTAKQLEGEISDDILYIDGVQLELDGLGQEDTDSLKQQNTLNESLQQLKLDVVALQGEVQINLNDISQIDRLWQTKLERKEKIISDIADLEAKDAERSESYKQLSEKTQELRQFIALKEEENKGFVATRLEIEGERTKISAENRQLSSEKEALSGQMAKVGEKIASMETSYDEIISKLWEEYELTVQTAREFAGEISDEVQTRKNLAAVKAAIKRLGNVNVGAVEEYKEVFEKYTFLKTQLSDLDQSKNQLTKLITSLSGEMRTMFTQSFAVINTNFGKIFTELFGGGSAKLVLTDEEDVLTSGIDIIVSPPGKVIKSLTSLSGGEQALVAISIYFAILAHNPSPFCILDEIEAALDDVNVTRYANYLHRICDQTQFIVITHRRGTMEAADVLYGVTMQEDGISKLLKLDVNNLSPSILN